MSDISNQIKINTFRTHYVFNAHFPELHESQLEEELIRCMEYLNLFASIVPREKVRQNHHPL